MGLRTIMRWYGIWVKGAITSLFIPLLAGAPLYGQGWEVVRRADWGADFRDVCFVNAQEGWAIGDYRSCPSIILHTADGGRTWISQKDGLDCTLSGVCFVNNQEGWVVGSVGTILHTSDGGWTWEIQASNKGEELYSVHFVNEKTGWTAGYDHSTGTGLIRHTEDGGQTWVKQDSKVESSLLDIYFVNEKVGWIVGSNSCIIHTGDGGKINLPTGMAGTNQESVWQAVSIFTPSTQGISQR